MPSLHPLISTESNMNTFLFRMTCGYFSFNKKINYCVFLLVIILKAFVSVHSCVHKTTIHQTKSLPHPHPFLLSPPLPPRHHHKQQPIDSPRELVRNRWVSKRTLTGVSGNANHTSSIGQHPVLAQVWREEYARLRCLLQQPVACIVM